MVAIKIATVVSGDPGHDTQIKNTKINKHEMRIIKCTAIKVCTCMPALRRACTQTHLQNRVGMAS